MSRYAQQPEGPPSGYVRGSDISLEEWQSCNLAVDHHGELYCYLGYRPDRDQRRDLAYYSVRNGSHNPDGRFSFRFYAYLVGLCPTTLSSPTVRTTRCLMQDA